MVLAGFLWGQERYRYPMDLPKAGATGGPQCTGLPNLPFEGVPPYVVADTGTNPWRRTYPGIVLNSDGLEDRSCSVRSTDRRATPIRSANPDEALASPDPGQVRDLRRRHGGIDRVPVLHLRAVSNRFDQGLLGGFHRCLPPQGRAVGARRGYARRDGQQRQTPEGQDGARHVRRRSRRPDDHRHPGGRALSQSRRRPLPGADRRSRGPALAARITDPRGPNVVGPRSRSASRRPQTRYPRPQSARCQRLVGVADPDLPGAGRHPRSPCCPTRRGSPPRWPNTTRRSRR